MINDPINFRDKLFQPHHSHACHLLIHLDTDSYSYAILDNGQNRLRALVKNYFGERTESFSTFDRLEILKAENEDVSLPYKKVKISVETNAFTFVPEELYNPADLPKYGKFIGVAPETTLLTADINAFGIKNITAVEPNLKNILQQAFPEPIIFSQANPFLAGIARLEKEGSESELFLNFNVGSFEAAILRKGALEFYNIFEVSNPDEFNYFILNLISQLNIDRNLLVSLSGEILSGDDHYQRLEKYFEKMSFSNTQILDQATGVFNSYRLFSLVSLDLCE
jgi:hypothetical protein